jgi:protein PhnA
LDPDKVDANHWRCLNDSMWSTVPAVQVVAWRMLDRLRPQGWSGDLLEMLYLDEETLAWAQTEPDEKEEATVHKDAFGALLQAGDTVILTQSLDVKGANFTAKRGTAVRNITLVHDNAGQIEGRVEGQKIVILTKYVRKSS